MKKIALLAASLFAATTLATAVQADEPDATTTATVAGATTGALVGGPVGAVVGGAMGMTTGAIIDESKSKQKTVIIKKRPPTVVIEREPDVVIHE